MRASDARVMRLGVITLVLMALTPLERAIERRPEIAGAWLKGAFLMGGALVLFMTLPGLALFFGGENGWRYAILTTGAMSFIYGFLFYWKARNTPKGSTYFKPKKSGGLEVTSRRDFDFLIAMTIPMYGQQSKRQLRPFKPAPTDPQMAVASFLGAEAAVQRGRGHAVGFQRVDLVLHQREQRRDHHGQPAQGERGQLVTD